MSHLFTFAALDLANERVLEAQRENANRRLVAEAGRPNWIRRRLTDAVRGIRSMFDDSMPSERRTQPRLPASHSH